MTDLDTLARAATQELLERTTPDVRSRYADLRRTRTRRTTAKLGRRSRPRSLSRSAAGSWPGRRRAGPIEPGAAAGDGSGNGVLLALPAADVGPGAAGRPLLGTTPAHLPETPPCFAQYQFTADGTEIVYADRRGRISAVDLTTGRTTRPGATAPTTSARRHRLPGRRAPRLLATAMASGSRPSAAGREAVGVLRSDVGAAGAPAWSPDGRSLAFIGATGVYVADLRTAATVRLVRETTDPAVAGPRQLVPRRRRARLLRRPRPVRRGGHEETAYTAMVVDLSTGNDHSPRSTPASCACLGVAAPYPDLEPGRPTIAVATTRTAAVPWGVYLVPPDGGEPERVASGSYAALAWQPLGADRALGPNSSTPFSQQTARSQSSPRSSRASPSSWCT